MYDSWNSRDLDYRIRIKIMSKKEEDNFNQNFNRVNITWKGKINKSIV